MKDFLDFKLVDEKDIPSIPLYMDQVTGYLETVFKDLKRSEDEKILTKTMINNYVKAGLIESPEKKKYSKDQIQQLMMIYMLKHTLQMNEIETVLKSENDVSKLYSKFSALDSDIRHRVKAQPLEGHLDEILELLLSASIQKKYAEMLLDTYLKTE